MAQWQPWWGLTLHKALFWSSFQFQYLSCSIVLVLLPPICISVLNLCLHFHFVFIFVFCISNWRKNTILLKSCVSATLISDTPNLAVIGQVYFAKVVFQPVSSIDQYFEKFQNKLNFSLFQIFTSHTFYAARKGGDQTCL